MGPVLLGLGKLIGVVQNVIAVMQLLKLAMLTNPFLLLAVAVVAIAILIAMNWDKIKAAFEAGLSAIRSILDGSWASSATSGTRSCRRSAARSTGSSALSAGSRRRSGPS